MRSAEKTDMRAKRRHTNIKFTVLIFLTALILVLALAAQWIVPYAPYEQDLMMALKPPSPAHPFGTDRYGRDLLSRVIMGGQTSVFSSLALVAIISAAGTAIGVVCGYYGGKLDSVLMRLSDIFLAFPGMVFAIAISGVLGGGLVNAVAALAAISWPKYARLARGQMLAIRNMPYMAAARLSGDNGFQMIFKQALPNMAGPILVTAVLDVGTMMMEIAGLSFLGLGAQPPVAEWGSMMSNGRSMIQTSAWVVLAPGFAIFITVMIFNLLGDTVRDMLDPKRKEQI